MEKLFNILEKCDYSHIGKSQIIDEFKNNKNVQNWLHETKLLEFWEGCEEKIISSLTHPSFTNSNERWPYDHNQRLEFLGDAALDFFISQKLIDLYPNQAEGNLSKLRSTIVNEESLSHFAKVLRLDEFILVGKSERGKELSDGIMADAFEALIGAVCQIYPLWQDVLAYWIECYQASTNDDLLSLSRLDNFDPKTTLQEKTLMLYKELPHYKYSSISEESEFQVEITLRGALLARAQSTSKKKASRKAARIAIESKSYLGL